MAQKKKIIKCFLCGTEWTAGEEEAHASTLRCPHCNIEEFSGNFIIKDKEDDASAHSRFKPQWGQPAGEKKEGDAVVFAEAEPKAASSSSETTGHKSQHKTEFGSAASKRTQAIFLESGGSDASKSSGSGGGQVYEYIKESEKKASKQPVTGIKIIEKKNEPKSLTEELTSGCFIVTATYGTESYDRIAVFYRFRDEFLLRRTAGKVFTQLYYAISPYPATVIRKVCILRRASRFFLDRLASIIIRLL